MNNRNFLILCLTVAACSDDSIGVHDLPNAIAEKTCDHDVACGDFPDLATCQASHANFDDNRTLTLLNDVDAGVIKYDASKAQACLDSMSSSCTFPGFHSAVADPNPCSEVFQGTIVKGGACVLDQECASGAACTKTDTMCDRATACCPGTCGEPRTVATVALGGTCNRADLRCASDAYCKTGAGQTGTCTTLIATPGAACDAFDSCVNPLFCNLDFSGGNTPPTCKKPAERGAACVMNDTIPCVDTRDHCDASMKCAPDVAVGGSCATDDDCASFASCPNGTCVSQPKLGEPCTADGESCLGDLTCISGKCALPPAGMSCK